MSQEVPYTPAPFDAQLLESLQVGVLLEKNCKAHWVNRRFLELFGFEADELIDTSARAIFQSDEDYASLQKLKEDQPLSGLAVTTEIALQRKNGSAIWCHVTGNAIEHGDATQGTVWTFADFSHRMDTQQQIPGTAHSLVETLARQEALLKTLQIGLLHVKDRKVAWGNQRFFDMFGYTQEELLGESTRIYFNSEEDYDSTGRDGYPLLSEGKPFTAEKIFKKKNGQLIWCLITGNAVNLDNLEDGFIWSLSDISDRVQAEQQMRDARESLALTLARQETLLGSLQVGLLHAKDRKVLWGNQRFFDMFGYTQDELLGQSTSLYFRSEEEFARIATEGYTVLVTGKPYATEGIFQRKDGSLLWCHLTGNAINPANFDEGFIWSFDDITARVEAQQKARDAEEREQLEAEKMAALGVVVAGVAHEINTPIGVSYTLVTHFRQKTRDFTRLFEGGGMKRSDLQSYVDLSGEMSAQLASNIERAANLIQSFKQIAVDQSSDDQRQFNLKDYLQEIIMSLMPTLRKTPHKIDLDCPDNIEMDSFPGALSQVITNLIMNALTHAFDADTAGTMTISVALKTGQAIVSFIDDGKGITAENLPRIFDPFFTTSRGAGGSGLGLNIVFNLVTRKLLGRVSCISAPGDGAVFQMELPLAIDAALQKQKDAPASPGMGAAI